MLDENRSNTVQGTKSLMEHKQFINNESVPLIFKYTKNFVDRIESENNLGYEFLI